MPQLNPSPWLMVFFLAWMCSMFIFLNKTINSTQNNLPLMKTKKETSLSWNWPWY